MKKSLVALAALAATSAFAQSSATLYGALDVGYTGVQYNKTNGDYLQRNGYAFGANDTSRWGLTASDDIGGGMKAEFKIESQIGSHPRGGLGGAGISSNGGASITDYTLDRGIAGQNSGTANGASSGYGLEDTVLGNRELWVAVSQGSTRVQVGYGVTALRSLAVETDAAQSNNYGNLIAHVVGGLRRSGVRVDQSFGNGLTASVGAFGSYQRTNLTTATGDVVVTRGYTANLQYKNGPVNAGIGYDEAYNVTPAIAAGTNVGTGIQVPAAIAAGDNLTKTTMAGASYDLGVAKVYGQIWNQNYTNNLVTTGVGSGTWSGESIGVRAPFGRLTAFGQFYTGNNKVTVAAGTGESRKVTGPSAGVRYDMSKRTYAYFNAGYLKTDASAASGSAANDGLKFKQTSIGLVNYF